MKIIIDIPEADYEFIKNTDFQNYYVTNDLYNAVYMATLAVSDTDIETHKS